MDSTIEITDFRHQRLQDKTLIRLIKIHHDLQDDCISCCLKHFNQDSAFDSKYVALSYMWGDPTPRYDIYINGRRRAIHTNLWQFINQMRRNKATDWFWTDSLCLDQACHGELNEQVSRVGDIYSQASHVVSWLGECEECVEALRAIAGAEVGGEHSDGKAEVPHNSDELYEMPVKHRLWLDLQKAWKHLNEDDEYWGRVWVFQEIACAKYSSIVCGLMSVDFENLLRWIERARTRNYASWRNEEYENTWLVKLADLRERIKRGKSLKLLNLLWRMSRCDSSRSMDRIYGLLGLAERLVPNFDPQLFDINYDKTLYDITWDIIFWTIENTPLDTTKGYVANIEAVHDAVAGRLNPPLDFPVSHDQSFPAPLAEIHDPMAARGLNPPLNHRFFPATPANTGRKKQAQTACKVYGSLAFGNVGIPQNLHFAIEGAVAHISTTHRSTQKTDAGVGALLGLSLRLAYRHPRSWGEDFSSIPERVAWVIHPHEGALPWFCTAHLPDHIRGLINRPPNYSSENSLPGSSSGVQDAPEPVRRQCCTARGCCDSVAVLEISDLRLLFRLELTASKLNDKTWKDDVAVKWVCTSCAI